MPLGMPHEYLAATSAACRSRVIGSNLDY